jgi:tetratricopeptide (TPR) repeat protein
MKSFLLSVLAVAFSLVFPVLADEGHHHEDMTADQLGTVHFPVSCVASVQKPFEKGVALLHSFWYEEAQKQFLQVAKDDPKCAMAYWGHALALWHQLWNEPDAATIKQGLDDVEKAESLKPSTMRERAYITAMRAFYGDSEKLDHEARATAYSNAMETVYKTYPEDHEAAAFYALSLLASEPENDTTFANRKKAGAILDKLFAEDPNHPGVAHYLIHTYDKPQLAELGLPAARRYAKIAPAAPHALHMPSHIFARVGDWQDDIDSNLASIAATRKTAAMHMGGEAHQFHAMDFLVYAYLQSGREADAMKVIEEVKSMPSMKMEGMDWDVRAYALSAFPATYALEMRHWPEAASLNLVSGARPIDNAIVYTARAIGAARSGNPAQAQKDVDQIEAIHKLLAESKKHYAAEAVEQARQEAAGWLAHANGKDEEAISLLKGVADKEDKLGDEPSAVPAREMLADLLLEMKRPEQALVEYKTDLRLNPNRFNGLYGAARAAEMAGKSSEANEYYAQLVQTCSAGNSDRPELARAKSLLAQK